MTKQFSLVIPVLNQAGSTLETLDSYYSNATYPEEIPLILIDNGSEPPVAKWIVPFCLKFPLVKVIIDRNAENVGVTKSLNQGWKIATENCCNPDFIFFSHSDVLIQESEWDVKVRDYLEKVEPIGVMGFGGAKGIGTPQLYKEPYVIHQLIRTGFFSNLQDAENHGRRMRVELEPCAVLDGFTLIVNTKLLEKINGFDEHYKFHMYDNDICVQAIQQGYFNFVLGIACKHNGGRTSTSKEYDSWLRKQDINGDFEIHQEAHTYFYEKFRGTIPLVFHQNKYVRLA